MQFVKSLNSQSQSVLVAVLLAAVFSFMPDMAFAGGGLGAVESELTSTLKTIRKIILGVVPIVAGIILIWKCVEGMQQQKSVMEILTTCMWIIGAASAIEVVTWIFGKFGGSV